MVSLAKKALFIYFHSMYCIVVYSAIILVESSTEVAENLFLDRYRVLSRRKAQKNSIKIQCWTLPQIKYNGNHPLQKCNIWLEST